MNSYHIEIDLKSKRKIWTQSCYISAPAADFLEFNPTPETIEFLQESSEREAKKIYGDGLPIHSMQLSQCKLKKDKFGSLILPKVRAILEFKSLPQNNEYHLSGLIVILYINSDRPASDRNGLKFIRSIDWDSIAVDYEV